MPRAGLSVVWGVRVVLKRQKRKYGRVLVPSLLWGRLPGPFLGMLVSLGFFQRRCFPVDAALRSLVSIRIAQLNGCSFCVDLNSYNYLRAAGAARKAEAVERWQESELYSEGERAALEYAEAVTERCASVGDHHIASLKKHFTDDEITVALHAQ